MKFRAFLAAFLIPCLLAGTWGLVASTPGWAQEVVPSPVQGTSSQPAETEAESTEDPESISREELQQKAAEIATEAKGKIDEFAGQVDENEKAQEASAGILRPIYLLAEYLAFPAFHWVAFAAMIAGVVSYALQLVLAKLVVLSKFSISFTEILSDALGLFISLVGLVLTTQAAAENSTFTQSPAAVLSASVLGSFLGFVFYLQGQRQEVDAVEGRRSKGSSKSS